MEFIFGMLYGRFKPLDLILYVVFTNEVFIDNIYPFFSDQICFANADTRRDIDSLQAYFTFVGIKHAWLFSKTTFNQLYQVV